MTKGRTITCRFSRRSSLIAILGGATAIAAGIAACGGEAQPPRPKISIDLTWRDCAPLCGSPTYKLYVVRGVFPDPQCLLASTEVSAGARRGTVAGPSIRDDESLEVGVIVTCPDQPDCAICQANADVQANVEQHELLVDATAHCNTGSWTPAELSPCD